MSKLAKFLQHGNDTHSTNDPVNMQKFKKVVHDLIKKSTKIFTICEGAKSAISLTDTYINDNFMHTLLNESLNENVFIISPVMRYNHRYCNETYFENHIFTEGINDGKFLDCEILNNDVSICRFSSDYSNYTIPDGTPFDTFIVHGAKPTPENTFIGYFIEPQYFKSQLDPSKELVYYCIQPLAVLDHLQVHLQM
jgi:hypothetical protein